MVNSRSFYFILITLLLCLPLLASQIECTSYYQRLFRSKSHTNQVAQEIQKAVSQAKLPENFRPNDPKRFYRDITQGIERYILEQETPDTNRTDPFRIPPEELNRIIQKALESDGVEFRESQRDGLLFEINRYWEPFSAERLVELKLDDTLMKPQFDLSRAPKQSADLPQTALEPLGVIDRRGMKEKDIKNGALTLDGYVFNPTARELTSLWRGNEFRVLENEPDTALEGVFPFVIDPYGRIIVGLRERFAGNFDHRKIDGVNTVVPSQSKEYRDIRLPHPSLIGGPSPRILVAGEVTFNGGKVERVDNSSGHFAHEGSRLSFAKKVFDKTFGPGIYGRSAIVFIPFEPGDR